MELLLKINCHVFIDHSVEWVLLKFVNNCCDFGTAWNDIWLPVNIRLMLVYYCLHFSKIIRAVERLIFLIALIARLIILIVR